MTRKKLLIAILALLIIALLVLTPVLAAKPTTPGKGKPGTNTSGTGTGTGTGTVPPPGVVPISTNGTTAPSGSPGSTTDAQGLDWNMIGAIVGILAIVGAAIGWWLNQRRRSKVGGYLKEINEAHAEYDDAPSKSEAKLLLLQKKLEQEYAKGHLDEANLDFLQRKIEKYLREVRTGKVETLQISDEAKRELRTMLKDGKVSREEYEAFVKSGKYSKTDIEAAKKELSRWQREDEHEKSHKTSKSAQTR